MDLPAASPLVVHTLESPRFVVAVLVLAAIVIWLACRYRAPRQTMIAVGGLLATALGLVVLAALVETTGERLTRETQTLVEAAVAGETAEVEARLHDDLTIQIGRNRSRLGKSDLLGRVPALREFIRSNSIRQVAGAGTQRDRGESVLAQTTTTHMGSPTPNEWRFRWSRDSQGRWQVVEMIWEQWGFNPVPDAGMLDRW